MYYQYHYRCITSWDPPPHGHPRFPPTTTARLFTLQLITLPTYLPTCPQFITVPRESSNDDDCASQPARPNVICTRHLRLPLPPSR